MIRRLIPAVLIGLAAAWLCYVARQVVYPGAGDFGYTLRLAGDILAGRDPYNYSVTVLTVPYPLTAAVFGLPLVWLPPPLAAAVFFGLTSCLLTYGILRDGPAWRLLMLASPLYLHSLVFAQWPPLITAMAFFAALLPLIVVKPQMVLPMVLSGYARITQRGVVLCALLLLASLAVYPMWPLRWLAQTGQYEGRIPLLMWQVGGPLVLLALLRWREKQARLLVLMALMPQRMFYDQLPLFLIATDKRAMLWLLFWSWAGTLVWLRFLGAWPYLVTLFIYLPCLYLVLRPLWHGASLSYRPPESA